MRGRKSLCTLFFKFSPGALQCARVEVPLRPDEEVNMPKFLSAIGVCLLLATGSSFAQSVPDVSHLALPGGAVPTNLIPRILGPGREIQVVVRLVDAPL